eukprot:1692159-Prymnesium_polylepis.1
MGHASSPLSVQAGGTGGIATHAHPDVKARPAMSQHHGAYATRTRHRRARVAPATATRRRTIDRP